MIRIWMKWILMLLFCFGSRVWAQPSGQVAATPQRPSFSTSTATTYPGWIEVEAGISVDEHLFDSPVNFKLGATQNAELFLGVSPLVNVSNGRSETGFGDMVVGGRLRFVNDSEHAPGLAGQISVKLPTADDEKGLGSGQVDYGFLFIASHATPQFGLDFNTGFALSGLPGNGHEEQLVGILTLSRAVAPGWGLYGEIYANHSFEFDNTVVITGFGGAYTVNPRFVIDAALNVDISDAPFNVQFLTGLTYTLLELW